MSAFVLRGVNCLVGLFDTGREDVDAGEPGHVVFLGFAEEEAVDGLERLDELGRLLVGPDDAHAAVIHAVEVGRHLRLSLLCETADGDQAQGYAQ